MSLTLHPQKGKPKAQSVTYVGTLSADSTTMPHFVRLRDHIEAVHRDVAGAGSHQRRDRPDQCGLAGTVVAEDGGGGAAIDSHIDTSQCARVAERDVQAIDDDRGAHWHCPGAPLPQTLLDEVVVQQVLAIPDWSSVGSSARTV